MTFVLRPTDNGRIPVTGKRDRSALLWGAYGACADQFSALLAEWRLCDRRQRTADQKFNRHNTKHLVAAFHRGFPPK
jgi:hypothetical protein